MFCYCLNNPVNMVDESGCYAFRTNSVMMADSEGRCDRGYAINCDCSDSYDMVNRFGKQRLELLEPRNARINCVDIVKSEIYISDFEVLIRGLPAGLLIEAFSFLTGVPFIGALIGIPVDLIIAKDGLPAGTYDMYVVTITGEKLIPMTDTYKSFTETFYIVDCVIGNKQEWYYWGSSMADLINFG